MKPKCAALCLLIQLVFIVARGQTLPQEVKEQTLSSTELPSTSTATTAVGTTTLLLDDVANSTKESSTDKEAEGGIEGMGIIAERRRRPDRDHSSIESKPAVRQWRDTEPPLSRHRPRRGGGGGAYEGRHPVVEGVVADVPQAAFAAPSSVPGQPSFAIWPFDTAGQHGYRQQPRDANGYWAFGGSPPAQSPHSPSPRTYGASRRDHDHVPAAEDEARQRGGGAVGGPSGRLVGGGVVGRPLVGGGLQGLLGRHPSVEPQVWENTCCADCPQHEPDRSLCDGYCNMDCLFDDAAKKHQQKDSGVQRPHLSFRPPFGRVPSKWQNVCCRYCPKEGGESQNDCLAHCRDICSSDVPSGGGSSGGYREEPRRGSGERPKSSGLVMQGDFGGLLQGHRPGDGLRHFSGLAFGRGGTCCSECYPTDEHCRRACSNVGACASESRS